MLNAEGAPLRGPESTTVSTAKSDVSLAHFLPGFIMSNNPAIFGTYSPSYKAETEVQLNKGWQFLFRTSTEATLI